MTGSTHMNPYPTDPYQNKGELPDPFRCPGGARVDTRDAWSACGRSWADLVVGLEYGGMPPAAESVQPEPLCRAGVRRFPGGPHLWSYRLHCLGGERPISFGVRILFPETKDPIPAIINGDGCWWYLTEAIASKVVESGCALVMFNRTELAEDLGDIPADDKTRRRGGLYDVYPGRTFGALSAWAWGYHRCVDLLESLPFIDTSRLAVTGHSRGGKTVLVAGVTDERISLVNDNGSCAGGSASFRYVGNGGETLNIVNVFPSWFGPGIREYVGREEDVPFDQHCLLAAVAPRPLLLTYALDDRWSNPEGMVQSAWAAGEVYRYLGHADDFAFHLRPGGHEHGAADWDVLLDYINWKWRGGEPRAAYNKHPYAHMKPGFTWAAPESSAT